MHIARAGASLGRVRRRLLRLALESPLGTRRVLGTLAQSGSGAVSVCVCAAVRWQIESYEGVHIRCVSTTNEIFIAVLIIRYVGTAF